MVLNKNTNGNQTQYDGVWSNINKLYCRIEKVCSRMMNIDIILCKEIEYIISKWIIIYLKHTQILTSNVKRQVNWWAKNYFKYLKESKYGNWKRFEKKINVSNCLDE